tara:strand:+ start:96 stop:374 length:279 start_codon:yes stop_codon:yes gene_type:complete
MSINPNVIFIDDTPGNKKKIKMWCPVCTYVLVTSADVESVKVNNCCDDCWLTFGQMRRESWKNGWRPDKETLKRYKQQKRILSIDVKKYLGE